MTPDLRCGRLSSIAAEAQEMRRQHEPVAVQLKYFGVRLALSATASTALGASATPRSPVADASPLTARSRARRTSRPTGSLPKRRWPTNGSRSSECSGTSTTYCRDTAAGRQVGRRQSRGSSGRRSRAAGRPKQPAGADAHSSGRRPARRHEPPDEERSRRHERDDEGHCCMSA